MSGLYLYWLKINNQERDCDGIFIKNAVLVVQAKSEKSLKVGGVGAVFGGFGGFVVIVRKGSRSGSV